MLIGGPYSFGKNIAEWFGATHYSRSTGYDIDIVDSRKEIVNASLEYDVVFVHAYTRTDNQFNMIKEIAEAWQNNDHKGYIIVTGSISTYYDSFKGNFVNWEYTSHKAATDKLCKILSKKFSEGTIRYKVTNIKPGMLDTEKSRNKPHFTKGISGDTFCKIIENILDLPDDIIIPEIVVDTVYGD
jgi:NAD(P)-dependent dehydrogenase (short-subunit alcohol dehydrogenase family)